MESVLLEIVIIVCLVLVNGFFAAAEISLVSARRTRLRALADRGEANAKRVLQLQEDPGKFLATVQVAITLVGMLAGVLGGATVIEELETRLAAPISGATKTIAIALVALAISFLSLLFGELLPKMLALYHPERFAMQVARPVQLFYLATLPAIKFLTASSRAILKLFGFTEEAKAPLVTEEEIKLLVSEGSRLGIFEKVEEMMIHSIFQFADTPVKKAMTPRTDIVAVEAKTPRERLLQFVAEEGYSRIPVYKGDLDHIAGIIHTKDIINLLLNAELVILEDILRPPFFVPETKKVRELLSDFQKKQIHMAIVLDEYGGTAGLITLEDIIEEIVGEIQDEYDAEREEILQTEGGRTVVSARIRPEKFNLTFGASLPTEEYETLGGFLIDHLGRIPSVEEKIFFGEFEFTVKEKRGHRLLTLEVKGVK
ncbi:MAG: hemolysin family protein [candidate division Zixibacteria bacterium]|nr:hemolysin family protein [candidate division Zixibacteria bacterium]MCI0596096.1 hemolysin family protein [candidate division Zixibacteria bacterium]